jgi:N-acetylmuramoyl-L-alanine amidase
MTNWQTDYLQINEFSRPGLKLLGVKGIVMHWTADPSATDENEVKFFDGSDGGGGRYASAHIFVDRDSARLDIPLNEVAYHANEKPCKIAKLAATASYYRGGGANLTAIGVEMCVEKDGTIHADTISRAVQVVADLCAQFKLDPKADIYRHYDITGKNCPAPWVTDSSKFADFKKRVDAVVNPPQSVTVASQPTPGVYVVKSGDSLTKIANQFKTTVSDLAKLNGIKDTDVIKVGQNLKVAGASPAAAPAPKAPAVKHVVLPATADSWRVYPTNKAVVRGNEVGSLNPKKFGGLTYEIIGNPQADVYTIKTDNFGKVNIYAAASTGAKIN